MCNLKTVIDSICKIRTLRVVGVYDSVLKDIIEVPVKHTLKPTVIHNDPKLSILPTELNELYRITNGAFFFQFYDQPEQNWAIELYSIDELAANKKYFVETLDVNRNTFFNEWEEFIESGNNDPQEWIDQLLPIGDYGQGGDLIILDQSKKPNERGRVIVLNLDDYLGGVLEPSLVENEWISLFDFLDWFSKDIYRRMPSTVNFIDSYGRQYAVNR